MKTKNHKSNRVSQYNHVLEILPLNPDGPIRIPRPTGITELSKQYQKTNNIEDKQTLLEKTIQHYINTNFQYCGIPLSIEQFANYINVEPHTIQTQMYNTSQIQYNLLTNEGQKDIYGAVLQMLLNGALSDRSNALQHASILQTEMGNAYVPFLSSEVTKALSNAQNTTNNMINLAKAFFGNTAPTININNSNAQQNNVNTLTVEKALEIIDSRAHTTTLLEDNQAKEALFAEYDLGECPEVQANMQQGIDTAKEGLSFNKITELKILDLNAQDTEDVGHINRRAHELAVDLESDQV